MKPHVIMVSLPLQGHVIPLLELGKQLAKEGIRVSLVNTESGQRWVSGGGHDGIHLVSLPDGDGVESMEALYRNMPTKIEELVEDGVACVIYDQSIGSIQQATMKMGVRSAAFLPAAAACLVLSFNIPNLIEDGIIDPDQGSPVKNEVVQLAPGMPGINPSDFVWNRLKGMTLQKLVFDIMKQNNKLITSSDWILCNSVDVLEAGAFAAAPQILPIGPLLPKNMAADNSEELRWLDEQVADSVIYVAFGSTILDKGQVHEVAAGLELINRPFLWVSLSSEGEFVERGRGRVVKWAPQQRVLTHPSVACFLTHCGWNSTVESVSNGVPMVCWPVMADQFINQAYVCDVWKVGVRLDAMTRGEIREKIEGVINGGGGFKERAVGLKDMLWGEGTPNSSNNFKDFVSWIRMNE